MHSLSSSSSSSDESSPLSYGASRETKGERRHELHGNNDAADLTSLLLRPSLLVSRVCQGFLSLRGSPNELWKCYALKFLDSYSYFSFSLIFTLFLSHDFGCSDVTAGTLYGAWGALITVYGLGAGLIVDNLGVAASLRLGFATSLVARICLLFTTSRWVLYVNLLVVLPLGNCLGIPVLTTGIRRYTTAEARGFAFGLFYVVMNVAALLSGPVVDMLTIWYQKDDKNEQGDAAEIDNNNSNTTWSLTSYRAIVLTGIVSNVFACLIAMTVREIKVENGTATSLTQQQQQQQLKQQQGGKTSPPMPNRHVDTPSNKNNDNRIATFQPRGGSVRQILQETFQAPSFRRFLCVCLIMLNVRMIFRHLDATLPKYMIREFGANVPKGTIYSINPLLIILLVPLVTAATTHVDPLVMMHWGSYISAGSVFFLALSTSVGACIAFVTVLSIGEAIWSPRLYDYTMSVCQEGREGTYMALSSAPLFLAKLPVGFLSGALLQRYCPAELAAGEERHSKEMWLIIGVLTATSPVLLTLLWGYVSKREDEDHNEEEETDVEYTELQRAPLRNPSYTA